MENIAVRMNQTNKEPYKLKFGASAVWPRLPQVPPPPIFIASLFTQALRQTVAISAAP